MTALISATLSYADIGFFVILAICLLGGIFGGVSRALKGFFKSVAIILVSLLLVGATLAPICNTEGIRKMSDSIASKASGWGAVFTEPIYIADDGSYYIYAEYDGSVQKMPLESASGNGLVQESKAKFAQWLAKRFITEENGGKSLSQAAADMITSIIVAAIAFILYCIALAIICRILRKIFKEMHSSENPTARAIDRTLGAIVAVALGLLFILLVLAIMRSIGKAVPSVDEFFRQSPVCGFFYGHNPIGSIFARIFG